MTLRERGKIARDNRLKSQLREARKGEGDGYLCILAIFYRGGIFPDKCFYCRLETFLMGLDSESPFRKSTPGEYFLAAVIKGAGKGKKEGKRQECYSEECV